VTEATRHLLYDVADAAELFDGASKDDLVRALSRAVDQVYFLRGLFAWASTSLDRALAYKSFSAYRRPFGTAQVDYLTRVAKGEADRVKLDRQPHRVEAAGKREDIPTYLRRALPELGTTGEKGTFLSLRIGVAHAHHELLTLRQLAVYEAGVARAHDIPSGPKGVRGILSDIDWALLMAATTDLTEFDALPERLRVIDRRAALRAVGAETTLTNWEYLEEHGLSFDRAVVG
jgi:hypothetical protein